MTEKRRTIRRKVRPSTKTRKLDEFVGRKPKRREARLKKANERAQKSRERTKRKAAPKKRGTTRRR